MNNPKTLTILETFYLDKNPVILQILSKDYQNFSILHIVKYKSRKLPFTPSSYFIYDFLILQCSLISYGSLL